VLDPDDIGEGSSDAVGFRQAFRELKIVERDVPRQ
jgi:hypothetical protein